MKPLPIAATIIALTSAALLAAPSVSAQVAEVGRPTALLGEWWTPGFNARVRIERCGDAVCGDIVWAWDETPKDIADKSPLVGRKVIAGMRAQGADRWSGGRLYNPEDGRDYKGALHLQSPTRLVVDGCVLAICKQEVWRRVDVGRCPPVEPGAARSGGPATSVCKPASQRTACLE
jgi:uncharacterized protein (DUF2147 family)